MKGVLILYWHHKDNKLLPTYRNIKSQDSFFIYLQEDADVTLF